LMWYRCRRGGWWRDWEVGDWRLGDCCASFEAGRIAGRDHCQCGSTIGHLLVRAIFH